MVGPEVVATGLVPGGLPPSGFASPGGNAADPGVIPCVLNLLLFRPLFFENRAQVKIPIV